MRTAATNALWRGLTLPRRAVRRLAQVGIFVKPEVSLEHQHLARRYVIHGVESGGATEEIGRYVSFANEGGEPLPFLHPIDVIGVNGLHAVVVAPVLVRVEMFRAGRTCELRITRHWPGETQGGQRPPLESKIIFRGVHGFLEAEAGRKSRDVADPGLPVFYSRAGERLEIPSHFLRRWKPWRAGRDVWAALIATTSCHRATQTAPREARSPQPRASWVMGIERRDVNLERVQQIYEEEGMSQTNARGALVNGETLRIVTAPAPHRLGVKRPFTKSDRHPMKKSTGHCARPQSKTKRAS